MYRILYEDILNAATGLRFIRPQRHFLIPQLQELLLATFALLQLPAIKRQQPLMLLSKLLNGLQMLRGLRLAKRKLSAPPSRTWIDFPSALILLGSEPMGSTASSCVSRSSQRILEAATWLSISKSFLRYEVREVRTYIIRLLI